MDHIKKNNEGAGNEWNSEATAEAYVALTVDPEVNWYEYGVNYPNLERLIPDDAKSILDFGCGRGDIAASLSKKYEVTGADLPAMVEAAKRIHPDMKFVVWDGKSPIPDGVGTFDVIFSKLAIQFIEDLDAVIMNFRKILNDGGTVVVGVPNPRKISAKFGIDPNTIARYDDEIGKTGIRIHPIYRSQREYEDIFSRAGFKVSEVSEPVVPEEMLRAHGLSAEYNNIPLRLNMRFIIS